MSKLSLLAMLKFLKFDKSFEMHTNASDFTIVGMLMQDGRPIAYDSKKLNDYQRRCPIHKKEFFIIVHCLKI